MEKYRPRKVRIAWSVILLIHIILPLVLYLVLRSLQLQHEILIYTFIGLGYFWIIGFVIILVFFFCSLSVSYKEYKVNEKLISVYAGFRHHILRVDGDLCDEYVSSFTYTPVKLSTTIDHGINIDVTISLSNRITVKAKGKLILPTEKKASYVIY